MDKNELLSHIDHTLLKPFSTWDQIVKLCDEAVANKTASVCVPPCYISRIHDNYPKLNICTVVGFPLGYETTQGKIADTIRCLKDGANEIDMVINICEVKNQNYDLVENEIRELKKTSTGFGTAGATLDDIRLFKEELGDSIKIKAAGGIKTAKEAEEYIDCGCDRIGASSVVGDLNA